jgi:hypothetical protein
MNVMPIDGINDWEMRLKRQDAFWNGEVIDRPCVVIEFPRKEPVCSIPESRHATPKERWMDAEFQSQRVLTEVQNTVYMGDALPTKYPNIGPDFFPTLYGGEVIFEETTSFIKPFLTNWADADNLTPSREHPYWKKMEELYVAYLEVGKNTFYTGWPDLHPGADCLVGLRGPQNLAIDLFDEPEAVKKMLERVTADFLRVYDHYYNKLTVAGQACTGWPGIVSTRKWHVPSNDFSYMIGPEQFDEFFLEGLRRECDSMEVNLHHLDGPGCLNHLDSLLTIESLSAIQWVWGAGNGEAVDWIDVFQRIQAAGKGIQLCHVAPAHLQVLMDTLRPEGVWLEVAGVKSEEEATALLNKLKQWK